MQIEIILLIKSYLLPLERICSIKLFLTMLDTNNPNNYEYVTNHLEIHVLGGIKLNKLDSLRVTLSINKTKHHNKLRHNIDLYNDDQVEKLVRKTA